MSIVLRIILILMSLIACGYAVRKIRKSQMKIEYAMYWFLLSLFVLILSVFPQIAMGAASLVGVESPVNLVFLAILFLMLVKLFSINVKQSQLENKINTLTEEIAIQSYMENCNESKMEQKNVGEKNGD